MKPPEPDPLRRYLREIAVVAAALLIVLYLTACAALPEAPAGPPAAKPAFPSDMRLVCHEGAYYLGSVSADEVVPLPIKCL